MTTKVLEPGEAHAFDNLSKQEEPKAFVLGASWDAQLSAGLAIVMVSASGMVSIDTLGCVHTRSIANTGLVHQGNEKVGSYDQTAVFTPDRIPQWFDRAVIGVIAVGSDDLVASEPTALVVHDGGGIVDPELFTINIEPPTEQGTTVLLVGALRRRPGHGRGWSLQHLGYYNKDFQAGAEALHGLLELAPQNV